MLLLNDFCVVYYVDENLSEVIEEPVDSGKDDYAIDLPESIDGDEFKIPVDNFSDEELPGESKAEELSVEDLPASIADSEAPLPTEPDLEESNFSDSAAINENAEPEAAQPEPEAPVAAAVTEAMPADPDLPDLSDLDAMLKEAGL